MKIHKPSKGRNMARKNNKAKGSTTNTNTTTAVNDNTVDTNATTSTDTYNTNTTTDTSNTTTTRTVNINATTSTDTTNTNTTTPNTTTDTVTKTPKGTKDNEDKNDEDDIEDILDEYDYDDQDEDDDQSKPRVVTKKSKVSQGDVWIRVIDPKGHELAHSTSVIDLVLKDSGDYEFEIGGDYGEGLAVDIDMASVGCHQVSHKMTDVDFAIFLNRFQLNGVRQSVR